MKRFWRISPCRWIFLSGTALVLVLLGWYVFTLSRRKNVIVPVDKTTIDPSFVKSFPLPPISESPYLNVKAGADYVGANNCADCHPRQYQSYLRTNHSRSLGEIDLKLEPPDGAFVHLPSGRNYRVQRKANRLWHRESIQIGGEEILLSEYPMRYLFGSGTHTRSYVFETDGFLVESPISWYNGKPRWWISPGYDRPDHLAFERVASFRCVLCHTGRVEPIAGSPNRLRIHAKAIDCERCHGPGSLHVEKHRSADSAGEGPDMTIVHPGRLSRQKNEAICGQCHIGNAAAVDVRGRSIGDYRPSLALTDFRIDYDFTSPKQTMTVVGHFRQMRLSRCYQKSDTLTCTSCHHPHRKPPPERRIVYYRNKCLSCHRAPSTTCALDEKTRLERNSQDSCIACHMPARPTDVPHTAFTHHRIGLHENDRDETRNAPQSLGTLTPFGDTSHLSAIDRDRCLGLAYMQIAGAYRFRRHADVYQDRGRELLRKVRQKGLRDPQVDAALASLYWRVEPKKAIAFARSALQCRPMFPRPRVSALFVLSTSYFDLKDTNRAQKYLEQLVRCRREAEDWALLSVCRRNAGDPAGALKAARRAVDINPARPDLHALLAAAYRHMGDKKGESRHRRLAAQLENWLKKRSER